jgi:hypothetical protein
MSLGSTVEETIWSDSEWNSDLSKTDVITLTPSEDTSELYIYYYNGNTLNHLGHYSYDSSSPISLYLADIEFENGSQTVYISDTNPLG